MRSGWYVYCLSSTQVGRFLLLVKMQGASWCQRIVMKFTHIPCLPLPSYPSSYHCDQNPKRESVCPVSLMSAFGFLFVLQLSRAVVTESSYLHVTFIFIVTTPVMCSCSFCFSIDSFCSLHSCRKIRGAGKVRGFGSTYWTTGIGGCAIIYSSQLSRSESSSPA